MTKGLLSDDEQSYFREMESLFLHPGWDRLMKEMESTAKEMPGASFENATSMEQIAHARGRLSAMKDLMSYPTLVEMRRLNMEQARLNEIEQLDTDGVAH